MTRDTQIKTNKKELNKKSKKREELARRKKSNEQSDDDDVEECSTSDDEDDEMDVQEYRKFLSKMFPSKFIDKKIKADNKMKNSVLRFTFGLIGKN